MINSYSNTSQSVAIDETLVFNNNRIKTICTINHTAGTATFSLNAPGYYLVSFNGDGTSSGTAGDVVVQLKNGSDYVPGAIATFTSEAAADTGNLGFTTLIQVNPSCRAINNNADLTFVNTGVAATFTNVNVVITKIC